MKAVLKKINELLWICGLCEHSYKTICIIRSNFKSFVTSQTELKHSPAPKAVFF